VGSAMELHNVSAAQSALEAAPEEHRNWEWRYFSHQFDTAQHVIHFGEGIRALTVSPDGSIAAFQPAVGPARLIDVASRVEFGVLGNESPVAAFWFSPDGKVLAFEHAGEYVFWDVAAQRKRTAIRFMRNGLDLNFDASGTRVVSGVADRTVRVWNTTTGQQL